MWVGACVCRACCVSRARALFSERTANGVFGASVYFVHSYAPSVYDVNASTMGASTYTHTHTPPPITPPNDLSSHTLTPTPTIFLGPDLYTRNPSADNGVDLFHIHRFPALRSLLAPPRPLHPPSPRLAPRRRTTYTLPHSFRSPSPARSVFSTTEIRFSSNCPSTRRRS